VRSSGYLLGSGSQRDSPRAALRGRTRAGIEPVGSYWVCCVVHPPLTPPPPPPPPMNVFGLNAPPCAPSCSRSPRSCTVSDLSSSSSIFGLPAAGFPTASFLRLSVMLVPPLPLVYCRQSPSCHSNIDLIVRPPVSRFTRPLCLSSHARKGREPRLSL